MRAGWTPNISSLLCPRWPRGVIGKADTRPGLIKRRLLCISLLSMAGLGLSSMSFYDVLNGQGSKRLNIVLVEACKEKVGETFLLALRE